MREAKDMKILHVISTLDPRSGGPVVVCEELAYYQAIQGNSVTICSTYNTKPIKIEKIKHKGTVNSLVTKMVFHSRTPLLFQFKMMKWIKKI